MHRMRFHDSPIMAASLPHDSDVVCFLDYNAFLHFEMVLLLFQYNFLLHVYEIHEMYYFPEVLSLLLQQSFPHVLHKKKPFPLNSDYFLFPFIFAYASGIVFVIESILSPPVSAYANIVVLVTLSLLLLQYLQLSHCHLS